MDRVEPSRDFDFIGALGRRWVLVVVLTVLGGLAGYGASTAMSPVYAGTASLLIGDFEDGNVSNNEILAMQSLTATYADIARREPVLSGAADELGPGTDWRQLRKAAHIRVPNESPQVVEITVEASNRAWAAKAAGAIANSIVGFVDQTSGGNDFVSPQLDRLEQAIEDDQRRVDDLQAQQEAAGASAPDSLAREIERTQTQIALWQDNYASFKEIASTSSHVEIRDLGPAEADPTPVSPDLRFNTVMAAGFGFLLALAICYLLESRDRRRPDAPASTTLGFPIIVPPNLAHGTVPVPINGRSTQRVGPAGRTTDHDKGEMP
jgi:capsular polysaccharide biosynthesis protein